MATNSLKLELRFAWWFPLYFHTLIFFCYLTGGYPDVAKLKLMVERAVKVKYAR